jgi:CheY-specific phosphatase CheX
MTDDPKSVAGEVVDSFKSLLDNEAIQAIGEHRFHALQDMVREAIAEYSDAIVGRVEQNLRQIRSEMVERRSLEL